ncbi:MAG: hypothetical protein ORN54_11320 [Cyclobacteriaceae bacterium]|nr:hypothetical protein [Cyclobacteriaceae bacterium]
MNYYLNNKEINYSTANVAKKGKKITLLDNAIDLTANKSWAQKGFTVQQLFSQQIYIDFKQKIHSLLITLWKEAGLQVDYRFPLELYHSVALEKKEHLAAIEKTKSVFAERFPIPLTLLEERISEIIEIPLKVINPFGDNPTFHFRVVRPCSSDNNPLHRDVWQTENANCINLYIPIAGSNENSSLAIIPESHHWPECDIERTEEGAVINGTSFNVPAVTSIYRKFEVIRPNPNENEVLIFSPYLIHGGSVNLNANVTRISLEIRLRRK